MQHDLFGSGHDLDLRSNFIFDFSVSYYTPVRRLLGDQRTGAKEPNELFSL